MPTLFDPDFPIDGLTSTLADAVRYIHSNSQSPIEMCACSVLAAASLACEGQEDVGWREGAVSTTALTIIVEAESGERKSENDRIAFRAINRFLGNQKRLKRIEQNAHEIELKLWNLKVKRLEKILAKNSKKAVSSDCLEAELVDLLKNKPVKRQRAEMILTNTTTQALALHLATIYPIAALTSHDAATVISSGALDDVGMLNTLADGGNWTSNRVTRDRIELEDCRLSIYLQIQPDIWKKFLLGSGKALHGSGFSSRWLFTSPRSTQGSRTARFVEKRPVLIEPFERRLELLMKAYEGPEVPVRGILNLSVAAKELLDDFGQKVEIELAPKRWFSEMKGQGSKAAERTAMVAAVMHKFEGGGREISVDVIRGAIKLVAWFLNQHRMRFCPLSQEERDAQELEDCISRHSHKFKDKRYVDGPALCRLAPLRMRHKNDLLIVLATLQEQEKLKVWHGARGVWNVHLTSWHPMPMDICSSPNKQINEAFIKWQSPPPVITPMQAPQETPGYLLWPGAYLPE